MRPGPPAAATRAAARAAAPRAAGRRPRHPRGPVQGLVAISSTAASAARQLPRLLRMVGGARAQPRFPAAQSRHQLQIWDRNYAIRNAPRPGGARLAVAVGPALPRALRPAAGAGMAEAGRPDVARGHTASAHWHAATCALMIHQLWSLVTLSAIANLVPLTAHVPARSLAPAAETLAGASEHITGLLNPRAQLDPPSLALVL